MLLTDTITFPDSTLARQSHPSDFRLVAGEELELELLQIRQKKMIQNTQVGLKIAVWLQDNWWQELNICYLASLVEPIFVVKPGENIALNVRGSLLLIFPQTTIAPKLRIAN